MDLANIRQRVDEAFFTPAKGIAYYEPRALWGAQVLSPGTPGSPPQASESPFPSSKILSQDFKSRSKYPVTLTHLLVDGIGYLFDAVAASDPLAVNGFGQGARDFALQRVAARIEAPYRANFLRNPIELAAVPGEPRSADAAADDLGFPTDGDVKYLAGPLNVCRWDFDKPYEVPRQTTVDFGFSTYIGYASGVIDPRIHMAWSELLPDGGWVRGYSRSKSFTGVRTSPDPALAFPTSGANAVLIPQFYPVNGPGTETRFFPPELAFSGNEFRQQERGRGNGSSFLDGFSVAIDQALHDLSTIENVGTGTASVRIASLASRIGTRARAARGGTSEWWWNPGAPLSLVTPSMTPALVHQLAEPIVLAPGERLRVHLELDPRFIPIGGTDFTYQAQVGVSFCGFAAIPG